MSTVDYAVLILTIIVLAIIIISAVRNGVRNVSAVTDPNTRPGLWAWVAVIVLWFVVMLNYFDRQLLSALHEPIVRDIPQTEAQFGMVTSVFLLIYALLSPVGGFLADRYSRRLMILCSLVVWSVVTWWTGHAEDYTSLLIARGAMGISEAFYIPAALALITDYHRGSTRSIATGLHMSGIYVGMAIAGFGATMASWTGWRMTFALFGLIGVAYAIVLILFALLIMRGYWLALHARDKFGTLTIVGIITLLAAQVFLNIGVVTNLIPNTGISLPFFLSLIHI